MDNQMFDIQIYMREHGHEDTNYKPYGNERSFYDVVDKVSEHLDKRLEGDELNDNQKKKVQETEHRATLGDYESEQTIIGDIESYLRDNNLFGSSYPTFFVSLEEAIFHEIYRFGSFQKWFLDNESPSAKIVGKEIWFKKNGIFVLQEESLRNEEHIDRIFQKLKIANPTVQFPSGEMDLPDGTRIVLVEPPLSYKKTIVFRKFIVDEFSFEKQAKFETISEHDIPLFQSLSRLQLNTIISGEVESGKSTFLKTIYASRDPELVAVLIEAHPETFLKRDFPDRLVHDFYTEGIDKIEDVIRLALRVDHQYIIVQEVRGVEAEGAIKGTERGTRGLLMTYHITHPEKTAEQLAQHIVDEFPNRKLTNEVRRISKQIDIGCIMKNIKINGKNVKKIISIYEIVYDYQTDSSYINYIMKYNKNKDQWFYNDQLSENLIDRMNDYSESESMRFLSLLKKRAEESPLLEREEKLLIM